MSCEVNNHLFLKRVLVLLTWDMKLTISLIKFLILSTISKVDNMLRLPAVVLSLKEFLFYQLREIDSHLKSF